MEENTNFQISTSINEGILEVVITGEVTKDTFDKSQVEVMTILREKNPKAFLLDICLLKKPPDPLADAFFRVKSRPPEIRRVPIAVVVLSEDAAYHSFYETTAANVGHSIKFFSEIEAARAWLKSKL